MRAPLGVSLALLAAACGGGSRVVDALAGDGAATVDAGPDALGPPPPVAPHVTRVEIIATDGQIGGTPAGAPGASWGGHQSRIARLASGELYAAYLASPPGITDPSDAEWVLVHRGADDAAAWTEVARRPAGRDPMHLVRAPDDAITVIGWPGTPQAWTVRDGVVGPAEAIPGGWETVTGSSTPYAGVGVGADGRLCLAASRGVAGTDPSATYTADSAWDLACRSAAGAWSAQRTLPIGLRYCYPYLHLTGATGVELVGTRDVRWEAVGYPQVPDTFAYIFDAVDRWHFADVDAAPTRDALGTTPLETPATTAPFYWQSDSLVDLRGQLHLLVQSRRSTGDYRMEHVIIRTDGTIDRADLVLGDYTDGALRVVEDPWGRLFVLFVQSRDQRLYPTTDADGLVLGAPLDLTPLLAPGVDVGRASVTSVRGGTARAGVVDLVYAVGDDATTGYARIALYADGT